MYCVSVNAYFILHFELYMCTQQEDENGGRRHYWRLSVLWGLVYHIPCKVQFYNQDESYPKHSEKLSFHFRYELLAWRTSLFGIVPSCVTFIHLGVCLWRCQCKFPLCISAKWDIQMPKRCCSETKLNERYRAVDVF